MQVDHTLCLKVIFSLLLQPRHYPLIPIANLNCTHHLQNCNCSIHLPPPMYAILQLWGNIQKCHYIGLFSCSPVNALKFKDRASKKTLSTMTMHQIQAQKRPYLFTNHFHTSSLTTFLHLIAIETGCCLQIDQQHGNSVAKCPSPCCS